MNIEERKIAFVQLGKVLRNFVVNKDWEGFDSGLTETEHNDFNQLILKSKTLNGWFTEENVRKAIEGIVNLLDSDRLDEWLATYQFDSEKNKNVGVIMAGNIPMVGFHDALCVLLSGNKLVGKLSSEDKLLIPAVLEFLIRIEHQFKTKISFVDRIKEIDAVIATGSNNSARYFETYFGKYPNIIRKNRTSIALITGNETEEELTSFANDVFLYFGKGCRNVTKVLVPKEYDLDNLFKAFYPFKDIIHHHKYANNYDYNKAIYMMSQTPIIENGFLMLIENDALHSPLSILNYQYYNDKSEALAYTEVHKDELQCIVGSDYIPFGKAQMPDADDYADGEDTMKFLLSL